MILVEGNKKSGRPVKTEAARTMALVHTTRPRRETNQKEVLLLL
jgi:hypothetical protein